jgi:putative oxidoreductase
MATTYTPSNATASRDIRAAAGINDAVLAFGRILLAIIFVSSGVEKFMDLGATTAAVASTNLPYPNLLAIAAAAIELGGGVLIILGWQTRLFALALVIFTAVAGYFFHDFWNYPPGAEHTNNMIHFMKNVSMIGGLLTLMAVGAGRYSIDGPCIRPQYLK